MTIVLKLSALVSLFLTIGCTPTPNSQKSSIHTISKGRVSSTIEFSGRIRAENSILIRSPFDSNLVSLDIALGQRVEANQKIATLRKPEDSEKEGALIQKRGQLSQLNLQEEQAILRLKESKKELASSSRLLKSGSISAAELEGVRVQNELSKKELKILRSQIKTMKDEVQLLDKQQNKSSQTLLSPIEGTITQLWTSESDITVGMNVPKDTVVAVIEKSGTYIMKGYVTEPEYVKMEIGQEVEVRLIYLNQEPWKGKIKSLHPTPEFEEFGVGKFVVRVAFTADKNQIKTGLEGTGKIVIGNKENVLRVPRSAVYMNSSETYLTSPNGDKPTRFPAKVGLIGDEFVEIVEGVRESDQIFEVYRE